MTISLTPNVTDALKQAPMPHRAIVFFRERLKSIIHEQVFRAFRRLEDEGQITKRDIARRLDKDPATVTRLLGAPGNWTLETVSDLLLSMGLGLVVDVEDLTAPQVTSTQSATFFADAPRTYRFTGHPAGTSCFFVDAGAFVGFTIDASYAEPSASIRAAQPSLRMNANFHAKTAATA
jgi:hypothetical protein